MFRDQVRRHGKSRAEAKGTPRIEAMESRIHLAVAPPALVVATDTTIIQIASSGTRSTIATGVSGSKGVEVVGNTIYAVKIVDTGSGYRPVIFGYDASGTQVSSTMVPVSAVQFLGFTALSDGRFALLDNQHDKVNFISAAGDLLYTANVVEPYDGNWQNMDGVQVGNRLIIAEDGFKHVMAVSLDSYAVSTLKDLTSVPSWLGGIDYAAGKYYVGSPQTLRAFTESGSVSTVGYSSGSFRGFVAYGGYLYLAMDGSNAVDRMEISTGSSSALYTGVGNYDLKDIELAPASARTPLVITGTSGNDTILLQQSGDDLAVTLNGSVTHHPLWSVSTITVNALAGNDTVSVVGDIGVAIDGGLGNDSITGGNSGDYIRGDSDQDTIVGGGGADTLMGNGGNDSISGSNGPDLIQGGLGDDVLNGNDGRDLMYGGDGNDSIWGQGKADTLYGGVGNDSLVGGAGNDSLYGDDGNDRLVVQDDPAYFADQADGGAGTDWSDFDDNDTVVSCQSILA